jgi:hydrogenase expression/formation protein HypC
MCLGIPGRVVRILEGNAGQLALVDVLGARRPINLGMLEDPALGPGDWILIHMGFALERIDEAGAAKALSGLQMMGSGAEGAAAGVPATDVPAERRPTEAMRSA